MVGIYKKVKHLLKTIQKYSPFLSNIAPGLGEVVGSLSGLGENIADGVNNVYEDYSSAKSDKRRYGFTDGVKSFVRRPKSLPKGAMEQLTKSYGELHPRLQLKDEMDEGDEN